MRAKLAAELSDGLLRSCMAMHDMNVFIQHSMYVT